MKGWGLIGVVVVIWYLLTDVVELLDPYLFPGPVSVFPIFIEDASVFFESFISSAKLLLSGFALALFTGVPLGLIIGNNDKVHRVLGPLTGLLGSIPAIILIPYAVVLLPTFWLSSVFVLYAGAFWPIFFNTIQGVRQIEHRLIDSANSLGVSKFDKYKHILFFGSLPSMFTGITISFMMSLILLSAVEIVGASSGLGYYVRNFSDFGDYPRVIAGILFLGIIASLSLLGLRRLENYVLRWRVR